MKLFALIAAFTLTCSALSACVTIDFESGTYTIDKNGSIKD